MLSIKHKYAYQLRKSGRWRRGVRHSRVRGRCGSGRRFPAGVERGPIARLELDFMGGCESCPLATSAVKEQVRQMASLHHTIAQEHHNSSAPRQTEDAESVCNASPEHTNQRDNPDLRDRLTKLGMIRGQV